MTKTNPFRYFKTSPEIIRLAVMLYVRFLLSLRNVEDLIIRHLPTQEKSTLVYYNPLMPEVMKDPLPIYKQLRDEAPAYYVEEFDCWALSRFDDIWEQSADNDSYSAALRGTTPAHLITKQLPVFFSIDTKWSFNISSMSARPMHHATKI